MAAPALPAAPHRPPRLPSLAAPPVQFRAYERRENDESDSEDGYEGDFDEGGSDPFLAPVSSQATRMFMHAPLGFEPIGRLGQGPL